jgi:hypothetical protein
VFDSLHEPSLEGLWSGCRISPRLRSVTPRTKPERR